MPSRQTGTVAKWLNHKGIGFITPDDKPEGEEVKDVLVHFSEIQQETKDGFKSLDSGSTVEYELDDDPKNQEKKVAVRVTGPDGADCQPRTKKGRGKGKKKKAVKEESEEAEEEDKENAPAKEENVEKEGKDDVKKSKKGKGKKGKGKFRPKKDAEGKAEEKSEE